MSLVVSYIVVIVYAAALVYVTAFCLMQFHLLFHYSKHHRLLDAEGEDSLKSEFSEDWPFVTIQLPLYNEKFVVERLIDNIMNLDYPKDKYEVHILDDSSDDTIQLAKRKAAEYSGKGFNIAYIRRPNRKGYKAGALKDGMPYVKGEYIAIFDADFLPKQDFLQKTIPHFQDPKVGVVQTRWEHINESYSLLTRMQAFQLNVHFTVEQQGRESGNYLLQFNGTAGVWRKETIEDAGGWEADTLTEDLDLSYRAQLKGWKITFLEEVGSPAELPAEMNGLKSQQYRWMKGGAETARKILPTIWQSNISLMQKIHASSHLLSSSVFLFVFLLGVFSVPILFLSLPEGIKPEFFAIFLIGLFSIVIVYYVANVNAEVCDETKFKRVGKFLLLFPLFLALSMGLSLHNTVAVIQGYFGKQSAFVRTPKLGISQIGDKIKKTNYLRYKLSPVTIMEGLLALYFLFAVVSGLMLENSMFLIFHTLLFLGYGCIFYFSVKHMAYRD